MAWLLRDAEGLQELALAPCHEWLSDEDLVPVLARNPQLRSVALAGCGQLSRRALGALAEGCPRLQRLSLAHCDWVDGLALRGLADRCPALEELDLSHNLIGDRGARAAAKLLSHSRLRVLNLANNQVRAPGAHSLAHALGHNSNLISLNLRLNCIEDEGGQALAHALHTNKCLTTLHLGGNELSEPTATLLSQVLTINTTLTSINLSCNHIGLVSQGFWGTQGQGEALGAWAEGLESDCCRCLPGNC